MTQSDLGRTIEVVGGSVKKLRAKKKRGTYGLTELGKIKANEYGLAGPRWEVLNDLDDNGPSSKREISERIHIPEDKVKVVLQSLEADRFVTEMAQK